MLKVNMYQEKREEEDLPALKTITRKQIWKGKQLYGRFKRLIKRQNLDMAEQRKFYERNRISPNSSKNNAVRTNHIKARKDKAQRNSKCRLCGDRDETINHIISECSKLAQKKYKTRHNWVGKVIHLEMCKKFKLYHTNKGISTTHHLSENITRINSNRTLTYTDHLILTGWPELILINK